VYPASQKVLSGGCVPPHLREYFLEVVYPSSQKVLSGGCEPRISETTFRKYFLRCGVHNLQKVLSEMWGDLDKLNMFSVYTQHLSLVVFEIKDETY
jgi:hypothetical protein